MRAPVHKRFVTVNSDQPRPDLPQDTSKAAAADLNAVYGPSFTAQSGTYDVKGGILTVHPLVAKNPVVMASGNVNTYSFKVEGRTLTVTSVANRNGPVKNPLTVTLTRVE